MTWEFTKDLPIYIQLVDTIEMKIVSGEYGKGGKLLSIRDMASEAGVNPNTVQRAMAELERKGLIETSRASGKFITGDEALIQSIKETQAKKAAASFYTKVKAMGYVKDGARALLDEVIEKGESGLLETAKPVKDNEKGKVE